MGLVAIEPAKDPAISVLPRSIRWAFRRPFHLERLALAVQRVSGVGLLLYFMFHVVVTGTVASGRAAWEAAMSTLANPLAHLGELLLITGATFHAVNGIRVVLLEVTPLVGRARRPDYPYAAQSLGRGQRSILYTAMLMSGLSALVGIVILWGP
jgi:succinate dehydrogenase / fumarate reductase cytochrome b subunit